MPPIGEHQPSSSSQHHPNSHSSGEENHSPTKSLLADKDRSIRCNRSPSINKRASRVGVTNFINVVKSLHQGESINYFPVTKETLQEYIDSKRKALIKSGSLDQYLQHIKAYNIALGFGWDGLVFGPIIKKALDELRNYEDETCSKVENILLISSSQPQQTTLVNFGISQQSNPFSNYFNSNFYLTSVDVGMEDLLTADERYTDEPHVITALNSFEVPFLYPGGIINPQSISSNQTSLISSPDYLTNHQVNVYYDNRGTIGVNANIFSFEPVEGEDCIHGNWNNYK
ncbi:7484_t:CDS:1 [Funneliformis caledonium]|uniref:7484_t:CDS:1 n=1 Tax=Funneliformis caledonium TaxID=1117310 RepID=A0A9N8YMZ1_9GLOM|nr:7484_t:CDS:1 [Funneliformis caledonium]